MNENDHQNNNGNHDVTLIPSSPSPKNAFKAIGLTAGYFGAYLGIRIIMSFVLVFIYAVCGLIKFKFNSSQMLNWILNEKIGDISHIEVIATTVICFALVALIAAIKNKKRQKGMKISYRQTIQFLPIKPVAVALLLALGFSAQIFLSFLLEMIPLPESVVNDYIRASSLISKVYPLAIISVVICAPLSEELLFRCLMITELKKGLPTAVSIVIASICFGLMHGDLLWISYAFLLGIFISFIYLRCRSALAGIAFHMALNGSGYLLPYIFPNEITSPYVNRLIIAVFGLICAALTFVFFTVTKPKATAEHIEKEVIEQ